jgi:REP element-mobilizing transposase RayT
MPRGAARESLGALIGAFKSMVTRKMNLERDWPSGPVWQRGYHERIIRNEPELAVVRRYISNNPANWCDDPNNAIRG